MREGLPGFRNYEQVFGLAASPGIDFGVITSARQDFTSVKTALLLCSLFFFGALAATSEAQDALNAGPADAKIAAALKDVSAERIRANIEKLVSFGTRSTLSAQDAESIAKG